MTKRVFVADDDQNTVTYLSVVLSENGLIKPEMFVDKPVDPEAFVARVRQLIGS